MMALPRPRHLVHRAMRGRAFSERITILRPNADRNSYREYSERSYNEIETYAATAPASSSSGLVRRLLEGGVDLEGARIFWTVEELNPVIEGVHAGDQVLWHETRDPDSPLFGAPPEQYRVEATARWGGFSESVCTRREGQR